MATPAEQLPPAGPQNASRLTWNATETATGRTQWEPPAPQGGVAPYADNAPTGSPPPAHHHAKRRQYAAGQTQAYYGGGGEAILDPGYLAGQAAQPGGAQLFTPGL
ncbi:hypothetical protein FA13DRAFT_1723468, partial [Coprinellus micaceus]